VVAVVLRELRRRVQPGVTTGELDALAGRVFARHGARSAPKLVYDAPSEIFISVNDEAVHGVPGRRRLRRGDLVKLDVTAELDGFYADACESVVVGRGRKSTLSLIAAARDALRNAMAVATTGAPLNAIGAAVESTVDARGYSVCTELNGHGIGRRIHEPPTVPAYFDPTLTQRLTEGLVLTIEPIIAAGAGAITEDDDGWTYRTADGSLSAHAEHTLVIREGRPLVLTA
jgi:methionyl aminopeptidase